METTWTTSNHQSDPSGIKLFIQIAFTSSSNTPINVAIFPASVVVFIMKPKPQRILKPLSDYSLLSKQWRSNDTTTNRTTLSIQPEPREDHHGNTLPSSPKASHDQRHDTNNQERLEIGTCFASGMDTSRAGEQMTTTLPPKGSVWIHKKDGRIAIVKGYATITPESFPRPSDKNNMVKYREVASGTDRIEVRDTFTWNFKPLEQGD